MRVFKFLETKHAMSNVEKNRIKISRIADLNDPFELRPLNVSHKPELRRILDSWREAMDTDHGLLCFSRTWHDPVLWSHYGDKHRGVCLGYELDASLAEPVRYRRTRINPRLDKNKTLIRDTQLTQDMLFTKYERWQYEDEIRVYSSLDHHTVDELGHYYYECNDKLALREIYLGPLCEAEMEHFRKLVTGLGAAVHVKRTRLAYSKYSVVAQSQRAGRLTRVSRIEGNAKRHE
jgi:hypothetical protein